VSAILEGVGWLLLAIPLWIAGTVVFDGVHWALHRMLGSRWRWLRQLAWPHQVHHEWLDRELRIHPENQRKNVFCHLVPEYLTQLAFSGLLLWVLPTGPVVACALLQTGIFLFLLSQRGLDINHRPIEILDAYLPSLVCPPAYHALHHVYPDSHFSAYTKLVDWVVGGGAQLAGRRYALVGTGTAFDAALRQELGRAGAARIEGVATPSEAARSDLDVLVLCDENAPRVDFVEAFVAATRERRLPPEVWAVSASAGDAVARHYVRDVRVSYRAIVASEGGTLDGRAARTCLFWIRRGFHFVPETRGPRAWHSYRRFRRTRPQRPEGVPRARSRAALAASPRA
jgi:hypothetical protein